MNKHFLNLVRLVIRYGTLLAAVLIIIEQLLIPGEILKFTPGGI